MTRPPASRPCGSCPYRRDVPSGIWHEDEYRKLPAYDRPTQEQPAAGFLCHQQDGRYCAGWAGCHDMTHSLAVRFIGLADPATAEALLDYATDVPLFASGTEAAEHGRASIAAPDARAQRTMARLEAKRASR